MSDALLIIVSGPSGVGKSTLANAVREALGAQLSVSMTTRDQRPGEIDGENYYFVGEREFKQQVLLNQVLEYAEVYGNFYGTPREPVEEALAAGEDMMLEIDIKGARQVKQSMPEAFAIFIMPPSEDVLLERLRSRGREGEDKIQQRFSQAQREMAEAKDCGAYDAFVVNDDLADALQEMLDVIDERREG